MNLAKQTIGKVKENCPHDNVEVLTGVHGRIGPESW